MSSQKVRDYRRFSYCLTCSKIVIGDVAERHTRILGHKVERRIERITPYRGNKTKIARSILKSCELLGLSDQTYYQIMGKEAVPIELIRV